MAAAAATVVKYFEPQLKKLDLEIGEEVDIRIHRISGNGLLEVVLDSEYYRERKKSMRDEMAKMYEIGDVRSVLQKKNGGSEYFDVGEICVLMEKNYTCSPAVFHRVKVVGVDDDIVGVEGIDHFSKMNVPYHQLYHLAKEFTLVHPFRFTCQLGGMDLFEGTMVVQLVMERKPIKLPYYASGKVRELKDVGAGVPLPVMDVERFMGEEMFRLEYYVLEHLDTLLEVDDIGKYFENVGEDVQHVQEGDWIRRRGYVWLKDIIKRGLRRAARRQLSEFPDVKKKASLLSLSEDSPDYSLKHLVCASVPTPPPPPEDSDDKKKGKKVEMVRAIILEKKDFEDGKKKDEMERKLIIRQIDEGIKCEVKVKDVFPLRLVDKSLCCIPALSYPPPPPSSIEVE